MLALPYCEFFFFFISVTNIPNSVGFNSGRFETGQIFDVDLLNTVWRLECSTFQSYLALDLIILVQVLWWWLQQMFKEKHLLIQALLCYEIVIFVWIALADHFSGMRPKFEARCVINQWNKLNLWISTVTIELQRILD
jgi:hypothetical protein